jgi:hypothetical protein
MDGLHIDFEFAIVENFEIQAPGKPQLAAEIL